MKRLSLFLAMLMTLCFFVSCNKDDDKNENKPNYSELIVGKWKEADNSYFEQYYSDGTAKYWDLNDDIPEEDALPFTWSIDENNTLIQLIPGQMGEVIPQYCNIITLNETTFKYNNEALKATYTFTRVSK